MPRDWMHDGPRRETRPDVDRAREDERRDDRRPDDFGQADYSDDYSYDPHRRTASRPYDDESRRSEDFGQADYSRDYAFDPHANRGYRRYGDADQGGGRDVTADRDYGRRMDEGRYHREGGRDGEGPRSWMDRAGAFLGGRPEARDDREPQRRRRGPSDRVIWTIIVERLEAERGLDLRDLEIFVDDGEVTLNGTVRRKEDKRRIEDIADIEGVHHVQNNLRLRERRWF